MTIDFFKENYPNLYKDNEYYFEHNQTAIEYVVRAYTEGYNSGKMSAENKFEDENRILKSNIEMYKSRAEYLKTEIEELEQKNKTLDTYAKKLTETKIDETMKNRIKYLEEENQKLKADNDRLSNSLISTTKDDEENIRIFCDNKALRRKYDELKTENEALKNTNRSFVDSSTKSLNSLLNKFTDTQLASILGERGYKGEIAKSERLYSTNMQSKVGEKLETIKLGI